MKDGSVLVLYPSFNSYTSIKFAEIADKVSQEFIDEIEDFGLEFIKEPVDEVEKGKEDKEKKDEKEEADVEDDDDFEFSFVCRDHETLTIHGDDGIKPVFPIFNQDLVGCSSAEAQALTAGTYCVCMPEKEEVSPEKWKKSNSTGTSKKLKFRDLISRCNSDSKETMVFVTPAATCSKMTEKKKTVEVCKEKKISQGKKVGGGSFDKSGFEVYMRSRAVKEGDRRRTFLPYRKDLLGFFAIANGLSRNIHPF